MMWFLIFAAYGLLLWMGMYLLARAADNGLPRAAGALLAVVALALAAVLLQLPPQQVAGLWSIPLVALALLVLGLYAARREALESGEALWPDLLRSFDYSLFTALLFGGQVALVIWQATGLTRPMLLLLLLTVGSAITLQVWATPLASLLDRIALAHLPQLRQERALLRAESNVRTRLAPSSPLELPQEEFARLTRRAFSQMGNLTRLASNPLTRLPLVSQRLQARSAGDTTLERAAELRALLVESTERLKPPGPVEFDSSDEWRHYNALYFPYVVGLKPYSRRNNHQQELTPAQQEALAWFREQVPQRTLYNWQKDAAHLVAQHLREQAE
jgi:hypothetical protein